LGRRAVPVHDVLECRQHFLENFLFLGGHAALPGGIWPRAVYRFAALSLTTTKEWRLLGDGGAKDITVPALMMAGRRQPNSLGPCSVTTQSRRVGWNTIPAVSVGGSFGRCRGGGRGEP
jgi:hypothetical protein